MDSINFLGKADFPNSSQTMDMLQGIAKMGGTAAAKLGGDNYILSGCVDRAGVVSDGIIVIEGMPYNFEGGNKKDKLTIKEVKETLMAFGVEYPEARTKRSVVFSDNGPYNWGDFKQVLTNAELENKIENITGESPGFVKMWSGRIDRLDDIYMLADGRIMKTVDYPILARYYGMENFESFNLPNLSGMFIVGYDPHDADYNSIGKTGGEKKVQLTVDQMPKHNHDIQFKDEKWGDNANSRPFPNPAGTAGYVADTTNAGGDEPHENRPPFYTLAYVIKVKY